MILSNLGVKLPNTKVMKYSSFEGLTYQFYILLLFDFIFDISNQKILLI